jgi:hypothetical protein
LHRLPPLNIEKNNITKSTHKKHNTYAIIDRLREDISLFFDKSKRNKKLDIIDKNLSIDITFKFLICFFSPMIKVNHSIGEKEKKEDTI